MQKIAFQIGLKKFSWLKKLKNTVPFTYLIQVLNGEETIRMFNKKLQKTNETEFRTEKRKVMINPLKDLNGEETIGMFNKKLQKTNQSLELKKERLW